MAQDGSPLRHCANRFIKRSIDITLSLLAMPILGVLYLILGVLIKREDGGPIIHRRRVLGRGGVEFDAFKFRSMRLDAEEILLQDDALKRQFEVSYKLKQDPRLTRIGRLIRKYSLDEFPQFVNVLQGQMSLVGPRMITPPELEKYGPWQSKLLIAKPGMTGLWQVKGRQTLPYDERVNMDMFYIDSWSIWLDLYLLILTVCKAPGGQGAY